MAAGGVLLPFEEAVVERDRGRASRRCASAGASGVDRVVARPRRDRAVRWAGIANVLGAHLIARPEVLLLDEPASSVKSQVYTRCRRSISDNDMFAVLPGWDIVARYR